jgi:hypothetical protein
MIEFGYIQISSQVRKITVKCECDDTRIIFDKQLPSNNGVIILISSELSKDLVKVEHSYTAEYERLDMLVYADEFLVNIKDVGQFAIKCQPKIEIIDSFSREEDGDGRERVLA